MGFLHQLPLLSAVCAAILALGGVFRPRRLASNWAFVGGMLALAAESACTALSVDPALAPANMIAMQDWRLVSAAFVPGFWLLFSLTYARGNSDTFIREWRWTLLAAFILPVAGAGLFFHRLVVSGGHGGIADYWVFPFGTPAILLSLVMLACAVLVLMNLERTYRASVGTIRWRVKFMLMGIGLLFGVRIFTLSQSIIFRSADVALEDLNSAALLVAGLLAVRSFLRSGRIEVDVYPSHSVLQGSATVLLTGIYLLIVGVLARLLARFAAGNVFALEALLILSALAVLITFLMSDRLRMWLRQVISRHFERPMYDYRTVWRRFTEGTMSQRSPTELSRSCVKLVADVFQCLAVAIWVVGEHRDSLVLAASTSLSEERARQLAPSPSETAQIIAYFETHPEPANIETSTAPHAVLLKQLHPSEFPRRENRVCQPLLARGEVIALLLVGDHVGGTPFSAQDFDMLKCVGDHVTASLLNVQLGQKLVQAKEMEAFQTMAAFFVHDLKNAASTLSLMLKNLPVHFADPAFREDALRGISKSVGHINHVIGRLSSLRHELKINPVETDLNEIVNGAVAALDAGTGLGFQKELAPLPRIAVDRDQISKVVTNLVLNASEATGAAGEIRVATSQANGWVILEVRDSGCGMTPEFVQKSLFRPFQSTKKNGLGIGMFQSKMIVEVHGGRISVSSEPGAGTTFQVYLPTKSKG